MQRFKLPRLLAIICLSLSPISAWSDSFVWLESFGDESMTGQIEDAVAYGGAIYATGRVNCGIDHCSSTAVKFSMDGRVLWHREFDVSVNTEAFGITVNQQGVFIAGRTGGYDNNQGVFQPQAGFVKKFTLKGDSDWAYIDQPNASLAYYDIAHDENGLYVGGDSDFSSGGVPTLAQLSFEGQRAWSRQFGVSNNPTSSIQAHDGLVYVGTNFNIYVYNTDGDEVFDFPIETGVLFSVGMKYFDGHLYILGYKQGSGYDISKYDIDGNKIWRLEHYDDTALDANSLDVRADGIYVAGRLISTILNANNPLDNEIETRVTGFNFNGKIKSIWRLPGVVNFQPKSLVTTNKQIFMAGLNGKSNKPFVAQLTAKDVLTEQVRSLNDIDGDGYQELALLTHNYGAGLVAANIRSIGTDQGINHQVNFDTALRPVDFKILPDLDANTARELAVLDAGDTGIEIRDSLTAEKISVIPFNKQSNPVKFAILADQSGNGAPELAVLGHHKKEGWVTVEIRDSLSAHSISSIGFNKEYHPIDLAVLDDLNGDNRPEIAVLGTNRTTNTSKLEIRGLDGELLNNIWLGAQYNTISLVSLPPQLDGSPAEATSLAVLQSHYQTTQASMVVVDPVSGSAVKRILFDKDYKPVQAMTVEDFNNNDAPELALLGFNQTRQGNQAADTLVKIEERDSGNGNALKNIWLWKNLIPLDMTLFPDINGDLKPETGTLARDTYNKRNQLGYDYKDNYYIFIKDSVTGEEIDRVVFEL